MNTFSQRSKCRHSLYSAKGEGRGSEAGPSPVAPPPSCFHRRLRAPSLRKVQKYTYPPPNTQILYTYINLPPRIFLLPPLILFLSPSNTSSLQLHHGCQLVSPAWLDPPLEITPPPPLLHLLSLPLFQFFFSYKTTHFFPFFLNDDDS